MLEEVDNTSNELNFEQRDKEKKQTPEQKDKDDKEKADSEDLGIIDLDK